MGPADNVPAVRLLLSSASTLLIERTRPVHKGNAEDLAFLRQLPLVLGKYTAQKAVQELIRIDLKSRQPDLAELAAQALRHSKPAAALETLHALIEDRRTRPGTLLRAFEAVGAIGNKASLELLLTQVGRLKPWEQRSALVRALAGMGRLRFA